VTHKTHEVGCILSGFMHSLRDPGSTQH
jgi:hypothetical protein